MTVSLTEQIPGVQASEKLTGQAVQQLERQKSGALLLFFLLVTASFLCLFLRLAPLPDAPALFSQGAYSLTALLGAGWCLRVAWLARNGPVIVELRARLAWMLFGLALLASGLVNLFFELYQIGAHALRPLPIYLSLSQTPFYLLSLIGLLCLPVKARKTHLTIHEIIDALIIMLCLLGISWYLIIGPLLRQTRPHDLWSVAINTSLPCWDLLLLLSLVLFVHQRTAEILRPSIWLCSLGVVAQVWADSGFAYAGGLGAYHPGTLLIDPFWAISHLLIGLTPLYQYHALAQYLHAYNETHGKNARPPVGPIQRVPRFDGWLVLVRSALIYIPFLALLGLTLYAQLLHGNNPDSRYLVVLCALVFGLLIGHYVLATYENARLVHEKEQGRHVEEILRKATASLSSVLEMDLLLSHIVIVGAAELGFDTAALVMIEEYDRPLDEQTSLLARATTSDALQIMPWRLTGSRIPQCLALLGKEIEVYWREGGEHVMTPVHQWHIEQQVARTLFVPLLYQGKIQGSLAFSLREARSFRAQEYYLARAFAEDAANAMEHAHLYERMSESALFAQAMSNVAGRLNSVVATGIGLGAEIHHLICTEGAHALQANLAILYVHSHENQFVPMGAIACNGEPQTIPQEWPPIAMRDYNQLVFHSAQAALLNLSKNEPSGSLIPAREEGEGEDSSLTAILAPTQGATGQIYSPLVTVRAVHPRPVELTLQHPLQEALQRRGVLTAILVPLIIHQAPMGLLVLARTRRTHLLEKRAFAAPDLERAQDFAGQAAIAFTNARLYQQLHNAHRRLQELDQLKDQFMVTASHELRTPLTAVQGYLELLTSYHPTLPADQQAEFLEKASRGCEELILLLNNIMDASRLEIEAGIRPAHLERVSLLEVVESIADLILLQASQEKRELRVNISPHLMVKADPTRLRQVIRNVSVNALKYSPPGTPLSFSARPVFTHGASIILNITDYGKGISLADQARLFQRFVRLESDLNSTVRGSGLGLYISRRLVEAMNGRIWIESSGIPGEGTTFSIQLPMA